MNELDVFAIKYGTDKSSLQHNYTDIYYRFLNVDRPNIKNVLEIGVYQGNSLRMWRDFFQNASEYEKYVDYILFSNSIIFIKKI